jgi:hypothetical protein
VYTQSASGGPAYLWESNGMGNYDIAEAEGIPQGTKIVLHLKNTTFEFLNDYNIEGLRFSLSFFLSSLSVSPLLLNLTLVQVWSRNTPTLSDSLST